MAISPLDPASLPRKDRILGSGHGTAALGPSDSSDSGSDLIGAPGPGVDLGDANLDSDTDRFGTGERAGASGDTEVDGADIAPDQVITIPGTEDEKLTDQ